MSSKKFQPLVLFLILIIFSLAVGNQSVQALAQDTQVNIYFFWGDGCPHCEKAKPILEEIAQGDPGIEMYEFEVYNDQANLDLFFEVAAAYGFEPTGVPTIFVADRYWVGYSEDIQLQIEQYIEQCQVKGCDDPGIEILSNGGFIEPTAVVPSPEPTAPPVTEPSATPAEVSDPPAGEDAPGDGRPGLSITLPLIGMVDLSSQSMLISTLLISFVDGFNPCSIWVLSMLLAITLNTQSRKKVMIVGLVFIFVTGLVYALFIAGLFTVLRIVSFVGWIQVVVALVALFFGLVNIKDYFWYKEGLSFTISDEKKPGIYKGIRRILNAEESLWGMIGATIVLAAGVSLVEFSCTAGFPVLWTNLLNSQNVTGLAFVALLFVYMLVYQIDELGIFLVSVLTLRKTKLEEKHGRALKLMGGMLMLALALVMLIDPTLMNHIGSSLLVFGAAFGIAGLVLLVHRVILPKFNIGSEKQ